MTFERLFTCVFMVDNVSIFTFFAGVVSWDMVGAFRRPVCGKFFDRNDLASKKNKNQCLSVYNLNEVTFLYYAFLKAQSCIYFPNGVMIVQKS